MQLKELYRTPNAANKIRRSLNVFHKYTRLNDILLESEIFIIG